MRILRTKLFPRGRFIACSLFGVLVTRPETKLSPAIVNHEAIHAAQQREMLYLPFFIAYFFEWLYRLFLPGNAYENLSFEREAYANQSNPRYLDHRPRFAQWRRRGTGK